MFVDGKPGMPTRFRWTVRTSLFPHPMTVEPWAIVERQLQIVSPPQPSTGITLTDTSMLCAPPPRMTPRSGTTSAKSLPQASVM